MTICNSDNIHDSSAGVTCGHVIQHLRDTCPTCPTVIVNHVNTSTSHTFTETLRWLWTAPLYFCIFRGRETGETRQTRLKFIVVQLRWLTLKVVLIFTGFCLHLFSFLFHLLTLILKYLAHLAWKPNPWNIDYHFSHSLEIHKVIIQLKHLRN